MNIRKIYFQFQDNKYFITNHELNDGINFTFRVPTRIWRVSIFYGQLPIRRNGNDFAILAYVQKSFKSKNGIYHSFFAKSRSSQATTVLLYEKVVCGLISIKLRTSGLDWWRGGPKQKDAKILFACIFNLTFKLFELPKKIDSLNCMHQTHHFNYSLLGKSVSEKNRLYI